MESSLINTNRRPLGLGDPLKLVLILLLLTLSLRAADRTWISGTLEDVQEKAVLQEGIFTGQKVEARYVYSIRIPGFLYEAYVSGYAYTIRKLDLKLGDPVRFVEAKWGREDALIVLDRAGKERKLILVKKKPVGDAK